MTRTMFLFMIAMFYTGMGAETFGNTIHGYCLIVTGFVIMIRLILPMLKTRTPANSIYYLQFWICVLGLGGLFSNKIISSTIIIMSGIGGFYTIIAAAHRSDQKEQIKKNLKLDSQKDK